MQLLCPKCHNLMAQYERNRVLVDQCTECKGIFLDRGEFEHLVEAEKAYYGGSAARPDARDGPELAAKPYAAAPRREDRPPEDRYDERRYSDRDRDDRRYAERSYDDRDRYDDRRHDSRSPKKRRKSMLEELFDF